jgi:hypothetical protein
MARARGLMVCAAKNEERNKKSTENLKWLMGFTGDDKARILYGCEASGEQKF